MTRIGRATEENSKVLGCPKDFLDGGNSYRPMNANFGRAHMVTETIDLGSPSALCTRAEASENRCSRRMARRNA